MTVAHLSPLVDRDRRPCKRRQKMRSTWQDDDFSVVVGADQAADGRRREKERVWRVRRQTASTAWLAASGVACNGQDHGWIGTRLSSSNNKCASPPFNCASLRSDIDLMQSTSRDADLMTIYRCTSHMIARPFTDHRHWWTTTGFFHEVFCQRTIRRTIKELCRPPNRRKSSVNYGARHFSLKI